MNNMAVDLTEVDGLTDIGMCELYGNPRFVHQHLDEIVVLTVAGMQAFNDVDLFEAPYA